MREERKFEFLTFFLEWNGKWTKIYWKFNQKYFQKALIGKKYVIKYVNSVILKFNGHFKREPHCPGLRTTALIKSQNKNKSEKRRKFFSEDFILFSIVFGVNKWY